MESKLVRLTVGINNSLFAGENKVTATPVGKPQIVRKGYMEAGDEYSVIEENALVGANAFVRGNPINLFEKRGSRNVTHVYAVQYYKISNKPVGKTSKSQ